MFCKHEWHILSEREMESAYERSLKAAKNAGCSNVKLPWQLCDPERKLIQIVACKKCGKLERFVTSIG